MDDSAQAIFERAAERARALGLEYAGAVTPREAWALRQAGAADIVDVRTQAEYEYVGRVPDTVLVEWRKLGERNPSPTFIDELAARFPRERPLLFLCRSAVRSHHAAKLATERGFMRSYNVLEGFEGDLDKQGHRGTLGGWRRAGLPWQQS
ncbi:MAG TPA: rhodanese-like domain-containing protein [Usitatibacter sp.]|nr:rhodanese-like domain-containing protein [Usitatibacter sp.]